MPSLAYVVCATPRSGSTLLCETLRATERAGRPLEHFEVLRHTGLPRQPREYFHGFADARAIEHLPPVRHGHPDREPGADWWRRALREGSGPNGVWGGKLMWGHVEDFLARARDVEGLAGADLAGALRTLLGEPRFVFVARADRVAQAISLWRAVQTQAWRADHEGQAPASEARYDFGAIDHLVGQLEEHDAAWRRWFAAHAIAPLEVRYEQLAADPRAHVARVLRFLGLPDAGVPAPTIRHQSDARSARWAARYEAERAAVAEA